MDPISEALNFGIKVTIWLVRTLFSVGWGVGAGAGSIIAEKSQAPPEQKLIEHKIDYELGQVLESQACPECGTANEMSEIVCYACGSDLAGPPAPAQTASSGQSFLGGIPAPVMTILGGIGGVIMLCVFCQACSSIIESTY